MKKEHENYINYIIFSMGFLMHYTMYKYFPPQRPFFDYRFILNCYHSIIFEFFGIFVSDYYIENHIERFFTHKFLEYEARNIKEIIAK